MCGRFALYSPTERIAVRFAAEAGALAWTPHYNIGPQQAAPVLRQQDGRRHLDLLRWGLVPSWADGPDIGVRLFNARSETAADKPAFRGAFRHRRCVVVADGFYEWMKLPDGTRQPYFISRTDGDLLAMAGLWEHWTAPDGSVLGSFTILTMQADEWMLPLHERMPVLLGQPEAVAQWLAPDAPRQRLLECCAAPPAGSLRAWPVARAVGNVRNDSPQLVRPLPDLPEFRADSRCA